MPTTKADSILGAVLNSLSLIGKTPEVQYSNISAIVAELHKHNLAAKIPVGTTGAISERLCRIGVDAALMKRPNLSLRPFGKDWKWLGDLLLSGHPYDVAISVKSFKAKARLLASGTGSLLTPTIGWGLFNAAEEWSHKRITSYVYRGFLAIYMPQHTLASVPPGSRVQANVNGRPMLRGLDDFPSDIINAVRARTDTRIDVRLM